jgi:hypothetical protein
MFISAYQRINLIKKEIYESIKLSQQMFELSMIEEYFVFNPARKTSFILICSFYFCQRKFNVNNFRCFSSTNGFKSKTWFKKLKNKPLVDHLI